MMIYEDYDSYKDDFGEGVYVDFDTIDELLDMQKTFIEQGKVVVAYGPNGRRN